mgnify:FL=1
MSNSLVCPRILPRSLSARPALSLSLVCSRSASTVKVGIKSRVVTVSGPRGELKRSFSHLQSDIRLQDGGKTIRVEIWFGGKKDLACLRTVTTHIQNMFTGVLKGYEYKMRFVYAHFPVNAIISDDARQIQIKNFLGEKITRQIDLLDGVTVTRSDNVKDEIVLTGNSIENVSQSGTLLPSTLRTKRRLRAAESHGERASERTREREREREKCGAGDPFVILVHTPKADSCWCRLAAALIQQACLVKNKDIRKFLDGIYVSESRVIGEE